MPVPESGVVDLDRSLAAALDDRTAVVSVMLVNNEVGTIQPLDRIVAGVRDAGAERRRAHRRGAGGAVARRRRAAAAGVDLVAISAHKFGGPKGTGALVVRGGVRDRAADRRRRPGGGAALRHVRTWPARSAMAAALRATCMRRAADVVRIGALRDRLDPTA